jgi:hypothetical protein
MAVDLINKLIEVGIASVAVQPQELLHSDLTADVASLVSRENRHIRLRPHTEVSDTPFGIAD